MRHPLNRDTRGASLSSTAQQTSSGQLLWARPCAEHWTHDDSEDHPALGASQPWEPPAHRGGGGMGEQTCIQLIPQQESEEEVRKPKEEQNYPEWN